MITFFDKGGYFNLDEIVVQRPSFKKVMEDKIVTDEEVLEQANLVISLLKQLELQFTKD